MKTLQLLSKILLFLLFVSAFQNKMYAQGWERTYGDKIGVEQGMGVHQTKDYGYIIGGYTYSYGNGGEVYLIKTDVNGDTLWTKHYGTVLGERGYYVQQTIDDGYIIVGYKGNIGSYPNNIYIIKTNVNGDSVWAKEYGDSIHSELAYSIQQTNDSGFIIAGSRTVDSTFYYNIYLIKTNINGDTLWTKTYGGIYDDEAYSVLQTNDNGYIVLGYSSLGGGNKNLYLIKTDQNGDSVWTKVYGSSGSQYGNEIKITQDSGFIVVGYKNLDIWLLKMNQNADTLWTKSFGGNGVEIGNAVEQTTDNGYILAGYTTSFGAGGNDAYLIKTDANGNSLWTKTFGGIYSDGGRDVEQTEDGGYIITGLKSDTNIGGAGDVYLIKTDSLGNTVTNLISGEIFIESINPNCIKDIGEQGLNNWVAKISPSEKYATADFNGFYSVLVDSGTFNISLVSQHPYYQQVCPSSTNTYTVNFTQFYDTSSSNNFGNQISIYCPLMWVDVATNIVRPCREGTYTVNYCNNGTADANNSYIEIEFPSQIIPLSSSPVSWSSVNGNTYRFDLGTVAIGQCGTIYITDSVLCDAVMGSTLCAKANIFPDTICTPLDTSWDKSSLVVSGECIGDSLACFTILNHGSNMTGNTQYRIYANDTLILTKTFQLNADDSIVYCIASQGKTIRLEADQLPGHPGHSRPRATVEGCGTPSDFGFVTTVPEDDEDDFVEEDCQVVRGSYDPNEKLVKPSGITANRYISAKDELEYQINFQNTGNDTAFLVVIRDTLNDNVVDIGSVVSGASSHPYSFRIYGQGILEWKFQNILLPDSNINEPKSHGFVKFKVKQANNPKGTVISNHAGIYFDFNAPVLTADATVTVFDTVFQATGIKESSVGSGTKQIEVEIVPNPFSENATLRITNNGKLRMEKMELTIYNLLGEKVKQSFIRNSDTFVIGRNNLPDGVYFYKITSNKEPIANGKLIIQ